MSAFFDLFRILVMGVFFGAAFCYLHPWLNRRLGIPNPALEEPAPRLRAGLALMSGASFSAMSLILDRANRGEDFAPALIAVAVFSAMAVAGYMLMRPALQKAKRPGVCDASSMDHDQS